MGLLYLNNFYFHENSLLFISGEKKKFFFIWYNFSSLYFLYPNKPKPNEVKYSFHDRFFFIFIFPFFIYFWLLFRYIFLHKHPQKAFTTNFIYLRKENILFHYLIYEIFNFLKLRQEGSTELTQTPTNKNLGSNLSTYFLISFNNFSSSLTND